MIDYDNRTWIGGAPYTFRTLLLGLPHSPAHDSFPSSLLSEVFVMKCVSNAVMFLDSFAERRCKAVGLTLERARQMLLVGLREGERKRET